MSKHYLIKLKPLEPFFFGGEYTFGRDDTRIEKNETSRYFAKSELFPQQSAVLGMLRKTILNKKNILTLHKKGEWIDGRKNEDGTDSKNHKEANRWVGRGRFSYERDFDMGEVIESISPLFITKADTNYFVAAKDSNYTPEISPYKVMLNDKEAPLIYFEGYEAKKEDETTFITQKGESLKLSEIYKPIQTVGIKKMQKEDGFFLKESYSFQNEEHFAFVVKSRENLDFLNKTLVALGADQSAFMMEVVPEYESFKKITEGIFTPKKAFDRIVLLSETLMTHEAYALCNFIVAERKSMRHLTQQQDKKKKKTYKSKRYYLFWRGTVLYTQNKGALSKALQIPYLQKAGINRYQTIAKGE